MRLKKDEVCCPFGSLFAGVTAKEMIEPYLEQVRGRGIAGKVTAEFMALAICLKHHGHGIPAYNGRNLPLKIEISRIRGLVAGRDCIAIRGVKQDARVYAAGQGVLVHLQQQLATAFGTTVLKHGIERVNPLLGLRRIAVHRCVTNS